MRPIRVVVVDDHEIVRNGLTALLAREDDLHLVGQVGTGEEAIDLVPEVEPDVILLDYRLPGMTGVQVCEELIARHPKLHVIMLTTFLDDTVIRGSIAAGAHAYLHKDVDGLTLADSIRRVMKGEGVLDPKVAGRVIGWAKKHRRKEDQALSIRETDVLRLVARGEPTKTIAVKLGLTENSVKTYLARAMQKMNVHSRSEAAAKATQWGLL